MAENSENRAFDPAFHGLGVPFTRFRFFISGTKIADANSSWNSRFLEPVFRIFQSPRFPDSTGRISLISDSTMIPLIPESTFPYMD